MLEKDCLQFFSSFETYFHISIFIAILLTDAVTFRLLFLWRKVHSNSLQYIFNNFCCISLRSFFNIASGRIEFSPSKQIFSNHSFFEIRKVLKLFFFRKVEKINRIIPVEQIYDRK